MARTWRRSAGGFRKYEMVDILYLAKGRPEFTEASLAALLANTNWKRARLVIYTDGAEFRASSSIEVRRGEYGGPVAIMNDYLGRNPSEIFAKIDNDTIVPPGWLDECLEAMEGNPELGLLGIEPPTSRTPAPWANGKRIPAPEYGANPAYRGYAPCDMIGGVGLMRKRPFLTLDAMKPHGQNGVGGFSDWQTRNPGVVKGWIVPPLNLFLLDRLPVEPWASLSKEYIASGLQRPWTNYAPSDSALWDWWIKP
jgi:hypothetical protein